MKNLCLKAGIASAIVIGPAASARLSDRLSYIHEALLEERRAILPLLTDPFGVPVAARIVAEHSRDSFRAASPWKRNVTATVFWVGELPTENNPTPNTMSAWDQNWQANFGGYDQPDSRKGYIPKGFIPALNPFYIALPYNDIGKDGIHRPEASKVIPWFWESYRGDGISVCKDRWLAIHHAGKVCFAQWEDVGPFQTDHWQYVFGKESARANLNQAAGIDLSPAVRDFLKLSSCATVEWRFVDEQDVPKGPWKFWSAEPPWPQR